MQITNSGFFKYLIGCCFILIQFEAEAQNQGFEQLSSRKSGISFKNQLREDTNTNILRYEYFYNGAGVAIGDLDNDGFEDIFFTGNMVSNKVYKNLGEFKFEDKTKSAGVAGKESWTTGVAMADVNGDGWLDIYVSYSGKGNTDSRRNELWINQKNFTFKDQAKEFGLDDASNSTQGLFFDFDRDGDLDLFLLNHHIQVITEIEFDQARQMRHPQAGDKLFRNDAGKYIDISEKAGIKGHSLGFGLGVVASDLNQDGMVDLLVTNDYIEPDYLYMNNGDGTFTDQLSAKFQHISHFSMGADIADINNDGLPDVYTLDMLPADNERQKLLYGPENYEQYALMIQQGFYHQQMRNMLQLNQGDELFSEIGQLAGISNTDWSWSALFFDATNDGFKDLLVTNGYYRDYTNRDFLKYKGDYYFKQAIAGEKADTLQLVTTMTSTPVHNYLFENKGDLTFQDRSMDWGFGEKNFSSGAAYADLDNDGDLDLVINHLNETAGVYRNTSPNRNFLKIALVGSQSNTKGIGSKITLISNGKTQTLEQQPVRGFQSSVSPILHFGLGESTQIDSVQIIWPNGQSELLTNITANQTLEIKQTTASPASNNSKSKPTPLLSKTSNPSPFKAQAAGFNDFKRQPLMLTMPSYVSPILAQGDLNNDGNPEVFFGGTKGQAAEIWSWKDRLWSVYSGFRSNPEFTDAVAIFEDFNGDGAEDLFVGSGGFQDYIGSDEALEDRLYLNDGTGKLTKTSNFPTYKFSTGTAITLDANGDGYPDLFVGAKLILGKYPIIPQSKLLINDGKGNFSDQTAAFLPKEGKLGMVTASIEIDLNSDGLQDLVLAGEFMNLTFLINKNHSKFEDQSINFLANPLSGWWGSLAKADMDGDGDLDLIAGNFGTNSQLEASDKKLIRLYAADFDENGSIDPILECFIGDKSYPYPSRDELLDQMVSMRSKFTDYASYSKATINELFSDKELQSAQVLEINTMESYFLENQGGKFIPKVLPKLAQSFPIRAILPTDLNEDGILDLILGGNENFTRIRIGMIDAGFGLVLLGDGKGNFKALTPSESGLAIKGDIKAILELNSGGVKQILFGIHQQAIESYQLK
jgi:hypothetical protein